jgi:hypothetical protein
MIKIKMELDMTISSNDGRYQLSGSNHQEYEYCLPELAGNGEEHTETALFFKYRKIPQ